ncbi:hypothetical protein BDP27DRAFT_1291388 [Rhodocollybia butyracea]|uniref:Uncharacterized protein n=1 Tax=Rhodocollybia butyracea TaxID=206335 RepID=A0A9P5Q0W0_9AGAR|nr:hypothetical protein BDP27DRAFT_1291388 [Rhodocollybia butyracea]
MPQSLLTNSPFTLDTSGIAGFFGGEEAVTAMSTVHFFSGRWLLGWYNSPGSYTIAKCYGRLARGKLWRGLFLGDGSDPAELFGLGGKKGPRFVAAESGTNLAATGHLAYLLSKRCQGAEIEAQIIPGNRRNSCVNVSIVHLRRAPETRRYVESKRDSFSIFLALLTIFTNIAVCIVSAVYRQWYSFAMILLGITANGISCLVIGSGILELRHSKPSAGSPRGDGVIINEREMIVLVGDESAVNFVTGGSFLLNFSSSSISGACALLLTVQFVLQLLLIPQSSLFGQILFLFSLAVSWAYNSYLASLDRESLQIDIISECLNLRPVVHKPVPKYDLATWTGAAVFVAYVLRPSNCRELLDQIIPNHTATWSKFKEEIVHDVKSATRPVPEEKVNNTVLTQRAQVVDANTEPAEDACILPTENLAGEQAVVVDRLMKDLRLDADYARTVYDKYLAQLSNFTQGGEGA